MNRTKRIKEILIKNFLEFNVEVVNDSFSHKGHYNFDGDGETHIIINLKKKKMSNINRLEIHKQINFLLANEFKSGLHSLQIKIS